MLASKWVRKAIGIVFLLALLVRPAHAIPYETFIDVDDEADLQDLLAAGDISQDTFDDLIDLLTEGVDLNTADRAQLYTLPNLTYQDVDHIIAYRSLQHGRIADPADLVGAGALTQEQLLSIAAFIVVKSPDKNLLAAHGWARLATRMSIHDRVAPPFALRVRMIAARRLTVGVALTTTRLRIGEPIYAPNRDALIADPAKYRFDVPKAYVKWEDDKVTGIIGSYRAGFAQRLVFDNSHHYTPNGLYLDDQVYYSADLTTACKESAGELLNSPCAGAAGSEYVTPDFVWRDSLLGVGGGFKKIELQTGWLQAYGFASASRRSIYQYELVEHKNPDGTDHCADPHDDGDPACGSPTVYVRPDGELLTPTTRFSFETLPNVFLEKLAGGNVTYYGDRRNSVGLTGYGAEEQNLVKGIDLDFQEWSSHPFGNRFGAIGANFSFGRDWLDIFGEAALSFDNSPKPDPALTPARGGGGPAMVLRMTATRQHEELEVTGRYFSTDFKNPYARPIRRPTSSTASAPATRPAAASATCAPPRSSRSGRCSILWTNPSGTSTTDTSKPLKLDTYARVNVRTSDELWLGLWEHYQDKDLRYGGHDQCFEVSTDTNENGDPIPCFGRQLTSIARARYQFDPTLSVTGLLEHQLLDDNQKMQYLKTFRQDVAAWVIGLYNPSKDLRLRFRARYLNESIDDSTYLETSVSALADAAILLRNNDHLKVRVDTKYFLDKRSATLARVPNPELTLWLTYEARL